MEARYQTAPRPADREMLYPRDAPVWTPKGPERRAREKKARESTEEPCQHRDSTAARRSPSPSRAPSTTTNSTSGRKAPTRRPSTWATMRQAPPLVPRVRGRPAAHDARGPSAVEGGARPDPAADRDGVPRGHGPRPSRTPQTGARAHGPAGARRSWAVARPRSPPGQGAARPPRGDPRAARPA